MTACPEDELLLKAIRSCAISRNHDGNTDEEEFSSTWQCADVNLSTDDFTTPTENQWTEVIHTTISTSPLPPSSSSKLL